MSQQSDRLERLISAQEGECCASDVEDRLETLSNLRAETTGEQAADIAALRTLGDDTRHSIARLLATADRELCVCEITPLFDVSESAVSHALSDLVGAGLATRRKEGTWRHYAATDRTLALIDALDDTREGAG